MAMAVKLDLFNLEIPDIVIAKGQEAIHDYIANNQTVYAGKHIFVSPLFDGVNDSIVIYDPFKETMTDLDWERYY